MMMEVTGETWSDLHARRRLLLIVCSRGHAEYPIATYRIPVDVGEAVERARSTDDSRGPRVLLQQDVSANEMYGEEYDPGDAAENGTANKPRWHCPRCHFDVTIDAEKADQLAIYAAASRERKIDISEIRVRRVASE